MSKAGRLLSITASPTAGRVLSREGKAEKVSRKKRGCLSGTKRKKSKVSAKGKEKKILQQFEKLLKENLAYLRALKTGKK